MERILFGEGCVTAYLQEEIGRLQCSRPFIITSASLQRPDSPLTEVLRTLGSSVAGVYPGAQEHVPLASVIAATRSAQAVGADIIVTVGGGSTIDTGKAVRVCLAAGLDSETELGEFLRRSPALATPTLPQVCVPTTLAGAEYTRSFSATDFTVLLKLSYTHSFTAPKVVVYDPRMTLATPMRLWLSSGVTAINHAVEVLITSLPHPVGDLLKLEAIRQLYRWLPYTKDSPDDLTARLHCQLAAWLADHSPLRAAPLEPQPAILLSHRLAYELAALYRVPYGISACVTLPAAMRWYAARSSEAKDRQKLIAEALGSATAGMSPASTAQAASESLETLIMGLGLPARLREVSIPRNRLRELASRFLERLVSPALGLTISDVMEFLELAW